MNLMAMIRIVKDAVINDKKKLNFLVDELIDNIINTPDEEILKEVEEDYGDSAFLANEMRATIEKCKIKAGIKC